MKLSTSDISQLRNILAACRVANITNVVIHEGLARGLGDKNHGAIFSKVSLDLPPEIQVGISQVQQLEKRLSLFGDIEVDIDVTEANKARKFSIKGKSGRLEFRCTDAKLIRYPKSVEIIPHAAITFSPQEISLISAGTRIMGAEQLTLQLMRSGVVRIEALDQNNDKFELQLEALAQFVDDEDSAVSTFDCTGGGVLLPLLESAKTAEPLTVVFLKSGQIAVRAFDQDMLAIPRIDLT